jgi:hypothetical protein
LLLKTNQLNRVYVRARDYAKLYWSTCSVLFRPDTDNNTNKQQKQAYLLDIAVPNSHRPGCIKRCQFVVKVNILSSYLIGGHLKLVLNQPIKWANFRLDALLADTMLTKLYATEP